MYRQFAQTTHTYVHKGYSLIQLLTFRAIFPVVNFYYNARSYMRYKHTCSCPLWCDCSLYHCRYCNHHRQNFDAKQWTAVREHTHTHIYTYICTYTYKTCAIVKYNRRRSARFTGNIKFARAYIAPLWLQDWSSINWPYSILIRRRIACRCNGRYVDIVYIFIHAYIAYRAFNTYTYNIRVKLGILSNVDADFWFFPITWH